MHARDHIKLLFPPPPPSQPPFLSLSLCYSTFPPPHPLTIKILFFLQRLITRTKIFSVLLLDFLFNLFYFFSNLMFMERNNIAGRRVEREGEKEEGKSGGWRSGEKRENCWKKWLPINFFVPFFFFFFFLLFCRSCK